MEQVMIQKYQIIREIGKGGMGCVYLVKDIHLGKLWAMKIVSMNIEEADGKKNWQLYFEQLEKEADTLKKLQHPLLPMIVDLLHIEGGIAIVMEFIEGITLERYIDEHGMISQKQAVSWGIQLAEVLLYLHSRHPGIVYGDMKPSNIMVRHDGSIKVIDFGTVMEIKDDRTDKGMRMGTYGYVAPELIEMKKKDAACNSIDQRSDIYSLGATLYHMVTGVSPAKAPYGVRPIRDLNAVLSEGLEKIIIRCTKKSLDERYQSCMECINDLKRYKQLELRYRCIKKIISVLYAIFTISAMFCLGLGLLRTYQGFEHEAVSNALRSVVIAGIALTIRRITVVYRQQKCFNVKQERNIICTEKKVIGLWCLIAVVMIHTSYCYAFDAETLPVQVKDLRGRNILIREESIYQCSEPIIFTWQEEENTRYEIAVDHGLWKEAEGNRYLFSGNMLPESETVVRINFRGQNMQSKRYFMKSFRIAVP